ncbi:MAG: glycoside hydrolase family 3 C-terminal domain-containing protein [Alistipes sp.]|nr:glycoside hydrolase family 3 C-terminal domain-containing protein [Alistipes sp.]
MKKLLIMIAALAAFGSAAAQQKSSWDEAYRKADEIIAKLSLEEKVKMTHGYSNFFFNGVPEKGIPYVYLSDATQGVHMRNNLPDPSMVKQLEKSTAFPCPIMLSATFNPELAYTYAKSIGEECRAGGIEVLLGPGINIYRDSQCGRNFEYFGEDPYLTSRMAENYVKGMQSTGTASCLKHFIANNLEFNRRRSNSVVDERALHEIYLPGFKAGIDAGAATVMTSYNQLNGEWCGQNEYVIKDLLRGYLGFRGGIMTDWKSVYDWEKVVKSGQNIKMPGNPQFYIEGDPSKLLKEGKITERDIETMIRPIIATCVAFGLYDREKYDTSLLSKLPEHKDNAYKVASEGIVLLKNNGILPLDASDGAKILVTGKFLNAIPRGAGSAAVEGYDNVLLSAAMREVFGKNVKFAKEPTQEMVKNADIVIVSVGTLDSESVERPFALPAKEEAFVKGILGQNANTVVVVNSGSGIRMTDWADKAAAIIYGWYPGQNGFRAIADVISGKINPSGKLPMTIEKEFSDSPAKNSVPKGSALVRNTNEHLIKVFDVNYDESVLVGYRWYETKNIAPLFPFGFGLSYTTFSLDKAKLSAKSITADQPVKVYVTLTNTGDREGAEVVQLYVSEKNPTVLRPKKELKGIKKVNLAPQAKAVIEFEVDHKDLAFWDDKAHGWKVNEGEFVISLGTSSADIACELPLTAK